VTEKLNALGDERIGRALSAIHAAFSRAFKAQFGYAPGEKIGFKTRLEVEGNPGSDGFLF
jgi:hypothetical protein